MIDDGGHAIETFIGEAGGENARKLTALGGI